MFLLEIFADKIIMDTLLRTKGTREGLIDTYARMILHYEMYERPRMQEDLIRKFEKYKEVKKASVNSTILQRPLQLVDRVESIEKWSWAKEEKDEQLIQEKLRELRAKAKSRVAELYQFVEVEEPIYELEMFVNVKRPVRLSSSNSSSFNFGSTASESASASWSSDSSRVSTSEIQKSSRKAAAHSLPDGILGANGVAMVK
jgi:1,4-alpha-glucan branching enzyme